MHLRHPSELLKGVSKKRKKGKVNQHTVQNCSPLTAVGGGVSKPGHEDGHQFDLLVQRLGSGAESQKEDKGDREAHPHHFYAKLE